MGRPRPGPPIAGAVEAPETTSTSENVAALVSLRLRSSKGVSASLSGRLTYEHPQRQLSRSTAVSGGGALSMAGDFSGNSSVENGRGCLRNPGASLDRQ